MSRAPNFDRIARPYVWFEFLTLGRTLERCRFHFLPGLADNGHMSRTKALVLGDGDGRFVAQLFAANSGLTADVVDTSGVMLRLLRSRCAFASSRLSTYRADAVDFIGSHAPVALYDLVVTHFFLDCLTQAQVDMLAASIVPHLAPNALWLVSDFRIPAGLMRFPARALVRGLYLAFRLVTGLRTTRLPDHAATLTRAGLSCVARHHSLFGMLSTEVWTR